NLVVEGEYSGSPLDLLRLTQHIEKEINLGPKLHNSPRALDIDLLWWGEETHFWPHLQIPHPRALKRNFVLSPMLYLRPDWYPPGSSLSILELSRLLPQSLKATMAIINLTPDSFSDGGSYIDKASLSQQLLKAVNSGVSFLDLGAESTRPNAHPLSSEEEWQRLLPALEILKTILPKKSCRPWISIDTYRPETLMRAAEWYLDLANDVSGLISPEYIKAVGDLSLPVIAMHNLGIPANPMLTLAKDTSIVPTLEKWFLLTLERATKAGIQAKNIYFDPGVGFGKTAHQSLEILQNVSKLSRLGAPLLIGHSRKSFLSLFFSSVSSGRDAETLGASLALLNKPIEILRVHNFEAHLKAQLVFEGIRQNE
ncbi:MAG: dihydropteroate synthase, partial [Bdellovibrionales bacterium]|nr:dihydropteroate synthase [Bdellovibrionales bacterium]